jgi:hypothetical protein
MPAAWVLAARRPISRANGSTDTLALPTSVKYCSSDPADGHRKARTTMRLPVK